MQRLPLQRVGVLNSSTSRCRTRASSRSCTHPLSTGSDSMTSAVRSTSFMSTQPRSLERSERRHQSAREPGHPMVVAPGLVLAARQAQALQFGLGLLRHGELLQVLAEPVFLGHEESTSQPLQPLVQVLAGEGIDHRVRRLFAGFCWIRCPRRLPRRASGRVPHRPPARGPGCPALAGRGSAHGTAGPRRRSRRPRPPGSNSMRLDSAAPRALCVCDRPCEATAAR